MLWLSWPRERIQNALTPCQTLDNPQKDETVLKKHSIRAYNHSQGLKKPWTNPHKNKTNKQKKVKARLLLLKEPLS